MRRYEWGRAGARSSRRTRASRFDLGDPLALRRIPSGTWTVTPRLDILTQAQRRALRDATVLDDDQADVLLAALAAGQTPRRH